jgi:hypothetical protein
MLQLINLGVGRILYKIICNSGDVDSLLIIIWKDKLLLKCDRLTFMFKYAKIMATHLQ